MGKRIDALRVAFARPKRTNWKAAYQFEKEQRENADFTVERLQKAAGLVADQLKNERAVALTVARRVKHAEERSDAAKIADPFRPSESHQRVIGSHQFESGHEGNAWRCKTCGKGTRDMRHKGHVPIPVPTEKASDEALTIVESLPGWSISISTPEERSTEGYYVSGRALNYSSSNASKRRAFVHVFTCHNISTRRDDDTIIVQGDGDYAAQKFRGAVAGWLWGADMQQIRRIAKAKHKYTKLCKCIIGETDDADNSSGQIGSIITAERKEE